MTSVVFPAPFGPNIATLSFSDTSKVSAFKASVPSGYENERLLIEISPHMRSNPRYLQARS